MNLVEMRGITKSFGPNRVLTDIDFTLEQGEVHALLGENGAGKSTLMKILMGVHRADAGTITLDGKPIEGASVAASLGQGIAMIFQELSLVPNGTVADNMFLGREPVGAAWRVDRRAMARDAQRLIDTYGFGLDARTIVGGLPFAQRQMVEILKAVARGARVLIMDEPTSSLTVREEAALRRIIDELRTRGIGIVYISHRMAEIFSVSDRISLVKDGRLIGPMRPAESSIEHIAALMSRGTPAAAETVRAAAVPTATVALEVRGLATARKLRDVTFTVRAGEVVGIAGLVGSGRSTLAKALFGLAADRTGAVVVAGAAVPPGNPAAAIRAGLALVPEDRRREGLVVPHGLAGNIALPNLDRLRWRGTPAYARPAADALFERFRRALAINSRGPRQPAGELSGGNQQKVVFAKWLATEPRVLILDEPTSGVDVNAKAEMRALMRRTAAEGIGVLLISSELEELATTADRVLLMVDGRLTRQADPGLHEAGLRALLQEEVARRVPPPAAAA